MPLKKAEYTSYIAANPLCKSAYTDKGTVTKASIKQAILDARMKCEIPEMYKEDLSALKEAEELLIKIAEFSALVKDLNIALDEAEKEKYAELTIDEVKELLVNHNWYYTIFDGISALYSTTSHNMANRISELANRYESTLPSLEKDVDAFEAKVKSHLERMGFSW